MAQTRTSVRHPKFYYSDGNIVISVVDEKENRNYLYRLYTGFLSQRSRIFSDLFSLPCQGNQDGASDENPFTLPGENINRRNFDHLLTYMLCGPSSHPTDDAFLSDVLSLSTLLEIDDGVNYAIETFERQTFFSPVTKIQLARLYRIDTWIEPAFRELLALPILTITLDDVDKIGIIVYHSVVHTKAKIEKLRTAMAFNCPAYVADPSCQMPVVCEGAWSTGWFDQITPSLLHPDVPCDSAALKRKLDNTIFSGVCHACQQQTVGKMASKGVFEKEGTYIADAVTELMQHQTDKAIRSRLSEAASAVQPAA